MDDSDADSILELCRGNTQYYLYCQAEPSREQILSDLHITPPGIDPSDKYYIGFYQGNTLVAVMDLIDGYPGPDTAFIGFFMMRKEFQGNQVGSAIIQETAAYLKTLGMTAIQLGIDKGNPQSTHFWKKNGFVVKEEIDRGDWTILLAEKTL
jgi:RimJ/RimL family protein N-acetyltransferase